MYFIVSELPSVKSVISCPLPDETQNILATSVSCFFPVDRTEQGIALIVQPTGKKGLSHNVGYLLNRC